VPLGGGVGNIFHFGKVPVNSQISAYYNVAKPNFGRNWQIRAQVQLMWLRSADAARLQAFRERNNVGGADCLRARVDGSGCSPQPVIFKQKAQPDAGLFAF
jgi:hypothetical protein